MPHRWRNVGSQQKQLPARVYSWGRHCTAATPGQLLRVRWASAAGGARVRASPSHCLECPLTLRCIPINYRSLFVPLFAENRHSLSRGICWWLGDRTAMEEHETETLRRWPSTLVTRHRKVQAQKASLHWLQQLPLYWEISSPEIQIFEEHWAQRKSIREKYSLHFWTCFGISLRQTLSQQRLSRLLRKHPLLSGKEMTIMKGLALKSYFCVWH